MLRMRMSLSFIQTRMEILGWEELILFLFLYDTPDSTMHQDAALKQTQTEGLHVNKSKFKLRTPDTFDTDLC